MLPADRGESGGACRGESGAKFKRGERWGEDEDPGEFPLPPMSKNKS